MKKLLMLLCIAIVLFSNSVFSRKLYVNYPGAGADIQPNIQSAANLAVHYDSLMLPAGSFILNKSVLIGKFVSIIGHESTGGTNLSRSESVSDYQIETWGPMIKYNINRNANSDIVVSNINFFSKNPSLIDGDGLSKAADIGLQFINCIGFRITNCKFSYFGNAAVSIFHNDTIVGGLIHHNYFFHNAKGYDALGLGYGVVIYGGNKKWVSNPKFGSSNFIFVEDNTFDYHRHSIAGGGCALYVFRYNTVTNNIAGNTAHAIDAHDAKLQGIQNFYATRAIEVYNNTIINSYFKDGTSNCPNGTPIVAGKSPTWLVECAIRTRGGEAVIHNNYIAGYRFGVGLINPSASAYPSPYQQGYISAVKYGPNHTGIDADKSSGDVFIWSDTYSSYSLTSSQCVYFYNYSATNIKNGRDYHLMIKPNYTPYLYPHPLNK